MRAIAGVLNAAVFKACASIITEMLSKVFTVAACWRLTSDVLWRSSKEACLADIDNKPFTLTKRYMERLIAYLNNACE